MELVDDIKGRQALYEKIGKKLDETVATREEPATFFKRVGLPAEPNKPGK